MAPRGRPPKPGTTRMDAAIDAMKPYGFTREVVMAKMRKLLKEYEGHYRFIEEDAYRVLLEALLDYQDNQNHHEQNQEQVALRETSKENEIVDGEIKGHAIVPPSGFIDIPVCSSTPLTVIQPPAPQSTLPPPPPSSPPPPPPPPPSSPPPPSPPQSVLDAVLSLPPPPPPPLPAMYAALPAFESAQPRRRKPCHGWISDDDEDLRFIIIPSLLNGQISPPESPPPQQETPLQQAQPELTGGGKTRPKRRSRWDLMPEDM